MSSQEANVSPEGHLNGNSCLERYSKLNFISSETGFISCGVYSKVSLYCLPHSFLSHLLRTHHVLSNRLRVTLQSKCNRFSCKWLNDSKSKKVQTPRVGRLWVEERNGGGASGACVKGRLAFSAPHPRLSSWRSGLHLFSFAFLTG